MYSEEFMIATFHPSTLEFVCIYISLLTYQTQ